MSTPTLVILAGIALGCYAIYLHRRLYFFQYLFLCRLPITVALVLAVLLPVSMVVLFENMLGNLADLGFFGILFTSWFAVHVTWVILFSMWMLFEVGVFFGRMVTPQPDSGKTDETDPAADG